MNKGIALGLLTLALGCSTGGPESSRCDGRLVLCLQNTIWDADRCACVKSCEPVRTVFDTDRYAPLFEGQELRNSCNTDADCVRSGCSDEVCAAEPVVTACLALPASAYPVGNCGCVEGQCVWWSCPGWWENPPG